MEIIAYRTRGSPLSRIVVHPCRESEKNRESGQESEKTQESGPESEKNRESVRILTGIKNDSWAVHPFWELRTPRGMLTDFQLNGTCSFQLKNFWNSSNQPLAEYRITRSLTRSWNSITLKIWQLQWYKKLLSILDVMIKQNFNLQFRKWNSTRAINSKKSSVALNLDCHLSLAGWNSISRQVETLSHRYFPSSTPT